jgi:hypothetical protein
MLNDRWGIDAHAVDERLKQVKFSFAHFDLETTDLNYYQPIDVPEIRRPVVKPKRRFTSLFRNPFK